MIPSPMTWLTVPSYRWTASIIRSRTGSRILRASSGSRSASSSMEPLRSAKSTVTCLRSPSRALLEMRIFSARCAGVYLSGEVNREALGWLLPLSIWISAWPHFRQNFAPGRFGSPHAAQAPSRRAPHSSQNAAPTGFSCWHLGQVIRVFDLRRDLRSDGCGHRSSLGGERSSSGHPRSVHDAHVKNVPEKSLQKAAPCEGWCATHDAAVRGHVRE